MVFCSQVESLVNFEGRKRFLSLKEVVGLGPGSFALIGGIMTTRFERQSGVIDERINLLFDVVGKARRVSSSLVGVFESLLDGHH